MACQVIWTLLYLLVGTLGHSLLGSDDLQSISFAEFRDLDDANRRELIASSFESRLEKTRNFRYSCRQTIRTQRLHDGVLGKIVWPGLMNVYHRSRIGESYRLHTVQFGEDLSGKSKLQEVQSGFNSSEGISTVALHRGDGKVFGRIDTKHDTMVVDDRYSYWLTGPEVTAAEFQFPYLLAHKDRWVLNTADPEGLITLEVPWMPFHNRDKSFGWRHVWLDPEKGFMPVRGDARWEESPDSWRTEQFTVKEAEAVDGLWMPMHIVEVVDASSGGESRKGIAGVYEMTVEALEFGNVTEMDLEVVFPAGTEVVNAIEGVTYFLGDAGERLKSQSLFVGNRFVIEEAAPASASFPGLLAVNIAVVAAGIGWFLIRRVQRRKLQR